MKSIFRRRHSIALPLLLCVVALNACSWVPTPEGNHAVLMGGKGHLEYYPGAGMAYTYSNEKSFQHATQAITAIATAAASAAVQKAGEVTKQAQDANATTKAIHASDNALKAKELEAKAATTSQALPLAEKVQVNPITPP